MQHAQISKMSKLPHSQLSMQHALWKGFQAGKHFLQEEILIGCSPGHKHRAHNVSDEGSLIMCVCVCVCVCLCVLKKVHYGAYKVRQRRDDWVAGRTSVLYVLVTGLPTHGMAYK